MAGTSITALNNLYNTMDSYYKQLQDWKQKSIDALALVKEYERQKSVHEASGAVQDAINVSNELTKAYGANGEAAQNVIKYQGLYDQARLAWEAAKDQLSPQEQAQLAAQQDAQTAQLNAQAAKALTQNAQDQAKLFMQKSTSYIIIGCVVLVVAVVGYFIYKKYIKG